ncbi:MAG: hypothetical protein IPQ16_14215 [Geobacteraceae bacterium]|nr:hypothetical protein [Geobacteraceae bacterium]
MKLPVQFSIPAAAVLLAVVLSAVPPDARAEFYKYKDSSGNLIITNRFEDVPRKYRRRVKVVWDNELEAKDPLARRSAAAEKLRQQKEEQQERPEQRNSSEQKNGNDGKTLVITFDEETGQLIRRFE